MRVLIATATAIFAALLMTIDATQAQTNQPRAVPDLSGYWSEQFGLGAPPGPPGEPRKPELALPLRNGEMANLTNDNVIARRAGNNLPVYRPQFWEKVLDLDWNGNFQDPFVSCIPPGVARLGPPTRIVQTPTDVFFFYSVPFQRNDYRAIPIGSRTHPIDRDGTLMGDPIAHWDGDTLVVETEGFDEQTWIGPEGYVHGYELKVTERLRRDGDQLVYDVTVEDPEYLQRPWVMDTRRVRRNAVPNFRMEESPPCSERDNKNIVAHNREL